MRPPVAGRDEARRTQRVLLILAGLAFGLVTLTVGVARFSTPGRTDSVAAVSDKADQRSHPVGHVADDPVLATLDETLRADGIAGALRHLDALSAADPSVRRGEHHYSLEVGRLSYRQTHDAAESFRLCSAVLDTGCYHGVMDEFVATTPRLPRAAVARLCDGAPITAEMPVVRIQCVHGVGHGLARAAGTRVEDALAACDEFGTDQDRDACYRGVFQQVIEQTDARPDPDPFALDPTQQDPFAACTMLAERYRRACYVHRPTVILAANGEDVPAAFITCNQAPAAYIVACYQGVGAWISIATHWDPDESSRLCQLASLPFRPWCLDGAVAGMTSGQATADRPMALCHSTPPDLRTFCFEALGESIPALYADRLAQEGACAIARDPAWIQVCRRSAGLPSRASAEGNGVRLPHAGNRSVSPHAPESPSAVVGSSGME